MENAVLAGNPATQAAEIRPNILYIVADDLGWKDVGFNGCTDIKTPNLDKLHDQSLRFTDFHAAPMCTPTRGQLISGRDCLANMGIYLFERRTLIEVLEKTGERVQPLFEVSAAISTATYMTVSFISFIGLQSACVAAYEEARITPCITKSISDQATNTAMTARLTRPISLPPFRLPPLRSPSSCGRSPWKDGDLSGVEPGYASSPGESSG